MRENGIHHVTAISGPARRNIDFYARILGLRLVKKTVNFDDPSTYHLYYGDERGRPGTILTFFPWERIVPGRLGVGQTQETSFRVPQGAIGFWTHRLLEKGIGHDAIEKRFGEATLPFTDPDGMKLALVAVPGAESEHVWAGGEVSEEYAIRGFHSVSLMVEDAAPTGAILSDVLGFREAAREGSAIRYAVEDGFMGGIVDIHAVGGFLRGRPGAGSVHHIAFRATDDVVQAEMVARLAKNHRIVTTEQKDRHYFRSVYFREPGGVLFEIATDGPGFSADESLEVLGETLKLPPFLEPRRGEIEAVLPAVT